MKIGNEKSLEEWLKAELAELVFATNLAKESETLYPLPNLYSCITIDPYLKHRAPNPVLRWCCDYDLRFEGDPTTVVAYCMALIKNTPVEDMKVELLTQLEAFLFDVTAGFVDKFMANCQNLTAGSEEPEKEIPADSQSSGNSSGADSSDNEISDDDRDHKRVRHSRSRSPHSRSPAVRPRSTLNHVQRLGPHSRLGTRGPHQRLGNSMARDRRGIPSYRTHAGARRPPIHQGFPPRERSPPRSRPRHRYSRSQSPRRSVSPRSHSPRETRRPSLPRELAELLPDTSSSKTYQPSAKQPVTGSKPQGCRDYIEKGVCMRGENCEYTHADYLPMPTAQLNPLVMNNSAPGARPRPPVVPHVQPHVIVPISSSSRPNLTMPEPYNPEMPIMNPGRGNGLQMAGPGLPPRPRGYPSNPNIQYLGGGPRGPNPRLGPRQPNMYQQGGPRGPPRHQNAPIMRPNGAPNYSQRPARPFKTLPGATLEIKGLPKMPNLLNKLAEHFGKFGNVTEIKVPTMATPNAFVTYEMINEARAAISDPSPLFNNRFIKIFYHNPNQQSSNSTAPLQDGSANPRGSAKSRIGFANQPQDLSSQDHSAQPAQPQPKPVQSEPNMNPATLKLDKTAQRKPVIQTPLQTKQLLSQKNLLKRKQKLILHQKTVLKKIGETTDPLKKKELVTLAKEAGAKLKELEKQMSTLTVQAAQAPPPRPLVTPRLKPLVMNPGGAVVRPPGIRSPESQVVQKSYLDTELDMLQCEQTGENTAALQLKLNMLKREAEALGIPAAGQGSEGRSGTFSGRGCLRQQTSSQPSALMIVGVKTEEREEILKHFAAYGKTSEYSYTDVNPPTMVVQFDTGHNASVAATHGGSFKGRNLLMKWYKPPAAVDSEPVTLEQVEASLDDEGFTTGADDEVDEDLEALLLGGDEEEVEDDGDGEKRSW